LNALSSCSTSYIASPFKAGLGCKLSCRQEFLSWCSASVASTSGLTCESIAFLRKAITQRFRTVKRVKMEQTSKKF
jgi:hypothetical protein